MDMEFMMGAYGISMGAWLLALLVFLGARSIPGVLGLSVGFWSSIGSLYVLHLAVQRLFIPSHASRPRRAIQRIIGLAALKYALVAGLFYLSLRFGKVSAPALALGIGIPQVVIFLKAAGLAMDSASDSGRRV